jgi:hypothetical protein
MASVGVTGDCEARRRGGEEARTERDDKVKRDTNKQAIRTPLVSFKKPERLIITNY